jgi:hypothetical protein
MLRPDPVKFAAHWNKIIAPHVEYSRSNNENSKYAERPDEFAASSAQHTRLRAAANRR